jgi:hypothetical protein
MRQSRRTIVPPLIAGVFFLAYLLTYSIDVYLLRLGASVPEGIAKIRVMFLAFGSFLYAFYRVRASHLFHDAGYCRWLCLTPWSIDKPLPLEPVHPVRSDFAALTVLALLAYVNVPSLAPVPIVIFIGVYLVIHWLTLGAQQVRLLVISLFLVPFAIYPFRNPYIAAIVLVALYALCYIGLRSFLRDFPWNTKYWKADLVQELRKQAIRQRVIGWPFKFLNVYEAPGISVRTALVLTVLLTWWLHVIRWTVDKPYHLALLLLFACLAALVRTMTYIGTYWPPTSLLGRICTGRLIIPQYDKVFLAPICVLLAGTLLPFALVRAGMNPVWSFELSFFSALFLALSLPPKLRDWRLTGPYRIPANVQSGQPRRADPREQTLSELFSDKSRTAS